MRLRKDINPGAYAIRVPCIGPDHDRLTAGLPAWRRSRMFVLAEGWYDLDGPAFAGYWCQDCAAPHLVAHRCPNCGDPIPAGQSCLCFDNHCQ